MNEYITQIIMASLGALGYSLLFNVRSDKLLHTTIGGGFTWIVYIIISQFTDNVFICNMVSSSFATLYSELLARLKKAPATCYLIPSVIPLIPGGGLYYTMSSIISNDRLLFEHYFTNTIQTALGISIGIMIMSLIGIKIIKRSIYTIK